MTYVPRRVFREEGEFQAHHAAVSYLKARGFAVGRMQRGAPIGVLYGEYDIQKWRNLSGADRRALHGTMHADSYRHGPVDVTLNPGASPEVCVAFETEPAP